MSVAQLTLVSPRPAVAEAEVPEPVDVVKPRTGGRRVGFLSNRKPNAAVIQKETGRLAEQAGLTDEIRYYEKSSPGEGAPADILDKIASEVDVVMVGSADCGSCTTWCTYDAVELEKRGLSSILLVTEAFQPLADVQRKALGRPELAMLVVPHPIGGSPAPAAVAKAQDAWPRMEEWLQEVTSVSDAA